VKISQSNDLKPASTSMIEVPAETQAEMLRDLLVYVPVWLALAGWFAGSFARTVGTRGGGERAESVYRFAWLFGAAMIVVHIIASYWVVYGWSHTAAVEATAEETERVTGIRAGWASMSTLPSPWSGWGTRSRWFSAGAGGLASTVPSSGSPRRSFSRRP